MKLNRVRAQLVDERGDWPWSGYLAIHDKQPGFEGLATAAILLQFGKQRKRAIKRYQALVSQGKETPIWSDLKNKFYLGNNVFVEKQLEYIADQEAQLSEVSLMQARNPKIYPYNSKKIAIGTKQLW